MSSLDPGLCLSCRHALNRATNKGTTYLRCGLAATDDRFPKYPRLPVVSCAGFASPAAAGWRGTVDACTRVVLAALGDQLVGVYLHGSAASGDWTDSSDVDLLAVVVDAARADWRVIGGRLIDRPGAPLEMSVVERSAAAEPGAPWPFLLHVSDRRVVLGEDRSGDPDLLLHYAVVRARGTTVTGPPIEEVFGPVPDQQVRTALASELAWGLEKSDAAYAVLNACRAHAFAATGRLLSKLEGARWGELNLSAYGELIRGAAAAQHHSQRFSPDPGEVSALVSHVLGVLR